MKVELFLVAVLAKLVNSDMFPKSFNVTLIDAVGAKGCTKLDESQYVFDGNTSVSVGNFTVSINCAGVTKIVYADLVGATIHRCYMTAADLLACFFTVEKPEKNKKIVIAKQGIFLEQSRGWTGVRWKRDLSWKENFYPHTMSFPGYELVDMLQVIDLIETRERSSNAFCEKECFRDIAGDLPSDLHQCFSDPLTKCAYDPILNTVFKMRGVPLAVLWARDGMVYYQIESTRNFGSEQLLYDHNLKKTFCSPVKGNLRFGRYLRKVPSDTVQTEIAKKWTPKSEFTSTEGNEDRTTVGEDASISLLNLGRSVLIGLFLAIAFYGVWVRTRRPPIKLNIDIAGDAFLQKMLDLGPIGLLPKITAAWHETYYGDSKICPQTICLSRDALVVGCCQGPDGSSLSEFFNNWKGSQIIVQVCPNVAKTERNRPFIHYKWPAVLDWIHDDSPAMPGRRENFPEDFTVECLKPAMLAEDILRHAPKAKGSIGSHLRLKPGGAEDREILSYLQRNAGKDPRVASVVVHSGAGAESRGAALFMTVVLALMDQLHLGNDLCDVDGLLQRLKIEQGKVEWPLAPWGAQPVMRAFFSVAMYVAARRGQLTRSLFKCYGGGLRMCAETQRFFEQIKRRNVAFAEEVDQALTDQSLPNETHVVLQMLTKQETKSPGEFHRRLATFTRMITAPKPN